MNRNIIAAGALIAAAAAFPASAQVLGGVGGQVGGSIGGQIGAQTPSVGSLTGQVGQTLRETRGAVRDTAAEARELRPDVQAGASLEADAAASADQDGANLDVEAGAMVHGSDGGMLGTLVSTTRTATGHVVGLVVRAADGTVKTIPAAGAHVEGDVLVTGANQADFDKAPEAED